MLDDGMVTLKELINSDREFDCEMIVGDVDMSASFVWNEPSRITEYGVEKYKALMNATCDYNKKGNYIEVFCDDEDLGEEFVLACAGNIGKSEYDKIFTEIAQQE